MGYVALKRIEMGQDVRMPGEMIPEAEQWPNLNAWVKRGFVAFVVNGEERRFVSELRAGASPLALAPASKPHHITAAARALTYGTAPVVQAPTSPVAQAAVAVPPIAAAHPRAQDSASAQVRKKG